MFLIGYLIGTLVFAIIYGGTKFILDNVELNQRFEEYEKKQDEVSKVMVKERKEIREKLLKNPLTKEEKCDIICTRKKER